MPNSSLEKQRRNEMENLEMVISSRTDSIIRIIAKSRDRLNTYRWIAIEHLLSLLHEHIITLYAASSVLSYLRSVSHASAPNLFHLRSITTGQSRSCLSILLRIQIPIQTRPKWSSFISAMSFQGTTCRISSGICTTTARTSITQSWLNSYMKPRGQSRRRFGSYPLS